MAGKGKFLLGLAGLVFVLYSFMLNTHLIDLLMEPGDDTDSVTVLQLHSHQHQQPVAIAFHNHSSVTKHTQAPASQKHPHNKKPVKHGNSIKCLPVQYLMAYHHIRLNRDIHTAGHTSYQYMFSMEINPPPPKLS